MDSITAQQFIDRYLEIGAIFYFISPQILNSTEPHYHIIVGFPPGDTHILFVVSTTNFKGKENFIRLKDLSYSTLVYVNPSANNNFKKKCLIDCNDFYTFDKEQLINILKSTESIKYKGKIDETLFEQIQIGIRDSYLIETEIQNIIINSVIKP